MIARATALALIGLGLGAGIAPGQTGTADRAARACFPTELWNIAPGTRPCNRVTVEEDGSGRLVLGTARGAIARCSIPNPREEQKTFRLICHKTR